MPAFTSKRGFKTKHLRCFITLPVMWGVCGPGTCLVALARKTQVTWVNGIAYNLDHMLEGQIFISKLFGNRPVIFCHNPTGMSSEEDVLGYLGDLTQAGSQKLGRITVEVDSLVKHLRAALHTVGQRGRVIHIAHSQGALITALAAKQLTADEMSRIEVLGFGGAAALRKTPATPFHRCVNYYSVNDPLLFVVPSAAQALRSGFVGDDEFCFLAPREGDPIRDHNLIGSTYGQALKWEGERFQRTYVSPVYRISQASYLLVVAFLMALHQRLQDLIKLLLRPLLMWCIFCYTLTKITIDLANDTVFKPATGIAGLVSEFAVATMRSLTGEDKYQQVPPSSGETKDIPK